VFTSSIIRAMMTEAVRTSETSVYFYETTLRHIPEGFIFMVRFVLGKELLGILERQRRVNTLHSQSAPFVAGADYLSSAF
jgi:hypothetical protein